MTNPVWKNVLTGVAIGDAWGNPNEFQPIEQLLRAGPQGPDLPKHLKVTDDTQMTLYLADALQATRNGTMDEVKAAIAEQFIAYTHDKDFASRAPGVTVTSSLRRLESGMHWLKATDDFSDGCGTVMRVSPAAFSTDLVGIAAFSAAITHGTANAIAAAILNAVLISVIKSHGQQMAGALTATALELCRKPSEYGLIDTSNWMDNSGGDWLDGLDVDLEDGYEALAELLQTTQTALEDGYGDDPWRQDPCAFGGSGWRAHECLATALLAADAFPTDGWAALRRAVTTDGDSDSIGAVAGGLLGALHGQFWPEGTTDRLEPRYLGKIITASRYELLRDSAGVDPVEVDA